MEKSKILVIDNYDSFTYNLVHVINELIDGEVDVFRNDKISIKEVGKYDYIFLSPGPGLPDEAGILKDVIQAYGASKNIFGVCLGMQAIGEVYDSTLKNLDRVFHGYQTTMIQTDTPSIIFKGIEKNFVAGRYHSWVINKDSLGQELEITAVDEEGELMAIQHKSHKVYAVQFHPESIMTPLGKKMISNFLSL